MVTSEEILSFKEEHLGKKGGESSVIHPLSFKVSNQAEIYEICERVERKRGHQVHGLQVSNQFWHQRPEGFQLDEKEGF